MIFIFSFLFIQIREKLNNMKLLQTKLSISNINKNSSNKKQILEFNENRVKDLFNDNGRQISG